MTTVIPPLLISSSSSTPSLQKLKHSRKPTVTTSSHRVARRRSSVSVTMTTPSSSPLTKEGTEFSQNNGTWASPNSSVPVTTIVTPRKGRRLIKMTSFSFKDVKVQEKLLEMDKQERIEERSRRHTYHLDTTATSCTTNTDDEDDDNDSDLEQDPSEKSNTITVLTPEADATSSILTTSNTKTNNSPSIAVSEVNATCTIITASNTTTEVSGSNPSSLQEEGKSGPKGSTHNFSIISSLRRRNFIGNPTASFAAEKEEETETNNGNRKESTQPQPSTLKSTIVKYFQKDTHKPTLTVELPDEEETTIRHILQQQEVEEERETIRRQVESNKSIKAASQWRKAHMFASAVSKMSKPVPPTVDIPSTRRINCSSDDEFDPDEDFDDDYELREFGPDFFDV